MKEYSNRIDLSYKRKQEDLRWPEGKQTFSQRDQNFILDNAEFDIFENKFVAITKVAAHSRRKCKNIKRYRKQRS